MDTSSSSEAPVGRAILESGLTAELAKMRYPATTQDGVLRGTLGTEKKCDHIGETTNGRDTEFVNVPAIGAEFIQEPAA